MQINTKYSPFKNASVYCAPGEKLTKNSLYRYMMFLPWENENSKYCLLTEKGLKDLLESMDNASNDIYNQMREITISFYEQAPITYKLLFKKSPINLGQLYDDIQKAKKMAANN